MEEHGGFTPLPMQRNPLSVGNDDVRASSEKKPQRGVLEKTKEPCQRMVSRFPPLIGAVGNKYYKLLKDLSK
ncbi:hypothetical protein GW17_00024239 [Ensete ventricosum]|nr:hypothetical protein GW17_00024239 [Ensete ventricosum]RZS17324.1 hypothetical protein BHM03_00049452 [Ensete ventricosum]